MTSQQHNSWQHGCWCQKLHAAMLEKYIFTHGSWPLGSTKLALGPRKVPWDMHAWSTCQSCESSVTELSDRCMLASRNGAHCSKW